mgnify:CR=1 FL=1
MRLLSGTLWGFFTISAAHADAPRDIDYALYQQSARFQILPKYQAVWGSRDSFSHELSVDASARYWEKNVLRLGYDRLSRSYASTEALNDHIFRVGHVTTLTSYLYLDAEGAYSHDPHFSAEWKGILDLHGILPEGSDIGLAVTGAHYSNSNSISLKPSWSKEFTDQVLIGLSSTIALKPNRAVAASAFARFRFTSRWSTRLSVGGGKTDDGGGIIARFFEVGGTVGYFVCKPFELSIGGALYNANNRDEYRLSPALNLIF